MTEKVDGFGLRLVQAGFLLFLLGLMTGLVVPLMQLPRMGLSSHLEGVMNGMFLIGLGLVWPLVSLPGWARLSTFWLAIYGTFANWSATLISAMTGAAAMMPIAGQGSTGEPMAELAVSALLGSLALAMIAVCLLVLWGLQRGRQA
jgi:hydroxylaminobenzene mutase